MKAIKLFCILVILIWAFMAFSAPILPIDAYSIDIKNNLASPTLVNWFGYDEVGRSLSARVALGARISFIVAFSVVSISLLIGAAIGFTSAWFGGWVDNLVVRIIDIFLAFPGILLAIALAGILGPGFINVVFALSAVGWVGFARLVRAQTLSLMRREHVVAAQALGVHGFALMWRHIIPLCVAPLVIEATFGVAAVIIGEASLSFLGIGVQPPVPSWGSILREGTRYMLVAPHLVLIPAAIICLVVLSINILGDDLRDRLDVKLKYRTAS